MAGGTAVVAKDSVLKRKDWVKEGLIQAQSKSFTAAYTGNSMDSVVYQVNDISKKSGHEVIFDFDGNLVAEAVMDKETAFGTGEEKRKFSDAIRVRRARTTVDEGDKFDGVDIDSVDLMEFSDSRAKLADKWVRMKDQALLDVAQQSATHRLVSSTFGFNDFVDIENSLVTGTGFVTMGDATKAAENRMPLSPFILQNGEAVWLFVIDSYMKTKLLKDSATQNIFVNADVRGNDNRQIKGVVGQIGRLLVVEAKPFFGSVKNTKTTGDFVDANGYALFNKNRIQGAGLRQFRVANSENKIIPKHWTGESLETATNDKIFSRGLLLGAGAIQFAMGKEPDFKVAQSQDYGIKTESMMEFWCGCKATKLTAENDDYDIPIAEISHGIVAVDIEVTDIAKSRERFGRSLVSQSDVINISTTNIQRDSEIESLKEEVEKAKKEAAKAKEEAAKAKEEAAKAKEEAAKAKEEGGKAKKEGGKAEKESEKENEKESGTQA